jgi:tetratricopeptide (TPR) repeat protein
VKKLFVSYAHLDSDIVLDISGQLQVAGYEVWIDKFGIQGGDLWVEEIVKGISGCDIFLLFVSSKSILSDYVRRELDIAFSEKRPIIPVRIEDVKFPQGWRYQLAGLQYVDFQRPDWKSKLLQALGSEIGTSPQAVRETGRLKNPYSTLPVLEPVERTLILANREKELKTAVEHLNNHRLLLITGMPGIGKSTFARALLEFIPEGSPPPFWYNFERQRSSGNSLGGLLDQISSYLDVCLDADVWQEVMAFRNTPGGNASVNDVDVLISFLNQDTPIWLVFDNLETVLSRDTYEFLDEGLELLFDSLKVNTHNAKIIITNPFIPILKTGELFLESGTSALRLGGLNDDFAFAFLHAFGLQDRSKEDLEPLIREINGHPFVLNHVARYAQAMGSRVILESLPGGLEEINERFGDFLKGRLSSQEFNALQILTVLNREVTFAGLCQIAQAKPNVIMRLREKGLLQANEAGKFWLHNIVRNSLKPTTPDLLKRAHLRAMNFHRNQELPLAPQSIDDYASVLEWHQHAVGAADVVNAYAALYSTGMKDRLLKWNEYDLLVRLCEQTLSTVYQAEANLSQIEGVLSSMEKINVYYTLGISYFLLGDFLKSIAHLKSALNLLQPQDDELRIQVLIDLSESYNGAGDFTSAMDLCDPLAVLLSTTGNEVLHAKFLHLRGIIHRDQGHLELAINDLEAALTLYKKLNDPLHLASITGDLGVVYYYQNRFEEAIANYEQAILSYEINRDLRGVMIAHSNIGDILLQNEQYELAEKELSAALELARKKKIVSYELDAGLSLVESWIELSQLDRAEKELNALEPLILKQTSACILGRRLVLIGNLYWKRLQPHLAKDFFRRGLEELERKDCQYEIARACFPLAGFLGEQDEVEKAKETLQKAKEIYIKLNNQLGLRTVERRFQVFK